jgi:hypothetical protein
MIDKIQTLKQRLADLEALPPFTPPTGELLVDYCTFMVCSENEAVARFRAAYDERCNQIASIRKLIEREITELTAPPVPKTRKK